ncbi:hypothetical protein L7F22_057635 [Adiantum nelumboides]|nr:hypothetical protein [Adiantum nelumboides]
MEASSSAEMDGSVAALFEEPRPPASLQSSLEISAQTSEELKQLLMRATMELETAESQAKLYERELCLTKNLLNNARQERDAAREEVVKLKESFFSSGWLSNADAAATVLVNSALGSHGIGSGGDVHEHSLHIQHSSKASSSPGQHMQLDCISMLDTSKTHLSDLHWDLHDLPALRPVYPDVQSNNLSPLLCGCRAKKRVVGSTAAAVVSMEMDQHSDQGHMHQESAIFSEANELLEQEVQLAGFQGHEAEVNAEEFSITDVLQRQARAAAPRRWLGAASNVVGVSMPQILLQQEELKKENEDHTMMHNQISDLNEFLSCTDGGNGSANMSIEDQLDAQEEATTTLNLSMETPWQASEYADMQLTSNAAATAPSPGFATGNEALYSAPKHLPEPPEADLEVMLRSLPERGKLLQAVMQAGPLLQTLLVAGPLPRWHRPPPTATVDPMESRLMMQCCNNVGSSSMDYMHNSHFPMFPIPSSYLGMGASSETEGNKGGAASMSASWSVVPAATSSTSLTSAAALATWMAEMSSIATTTRMTTTTTTAAGTIWPKADEFSGGLKGGGGDIISSWMSTVMEPLLNERSKSSVAGPMLNTSTNVSYSNRLLKSSALLPKRLNFSKQRQY